MLLQRHGGSSQNSELFFWPDFDGGILPLYLGGRILAKNQFNRVDSLLKKGRIAHIADPGRGNGGRPKLVAVDSDGALTRVRNGI